jgi:hypothetical protein
MENTMPSKTPKTPKTPKPKKLKKLTVAELKRKMEVGTTFTMVDFHGQPVNKHRVVLGLATTYVKLGGDGIKEGEYSVLNWPKAGELTGTEDGFTIAYSGNGRGSIRYVWGEVKDERATGTGTQNDVPATAG